MLRHLFVRNPLNGCGRLRCIVVEVWWRAAKLLEAYSREDYHLRGCGWNTARRKCLRG